jgi:serine/threonine protein kinase
MAGNPEQNPVSPGSPLPPSTRAFPAEDIPPTLIVPPPSQDELIRASGSETTPPGRVLLPGEVLGDFHIREALGSGSFATVYLAEQLSLGRQVALKVAASRDSEARTLATLEHEHIVPVYAEQVDAARGLWLLCMKFVPGTDLEHVMRVLSQRDPAEWSGQAILDAVDQLSRHPAMFDAAALRDRERLAGSDFLEAVCWIGARVAEALAHAHSRGVLHRDIKPANILLNRYGRPLLSDFNLAWSPATRRADEQFGGTLRYMAPEHLDAFTSATSASRDAVDERSDIYSLGVVLYELLTGRPSLEGKSTPERLHQLIEQRRQRALSPRDLRGDIPAVIDRVVRRCLDPEPGRRYQKAEQLAEALDGCRELRRIEKDFPRPRTVTRLSLQHPVWMLVVLAFLPHLLGSAVNIIYNAICIVGDLSMPQHQAFHTVVLGYNAIVYPLCLWVVLRLAVPIFRTLNRLGGPRRLEPAEVATQRRRAVALPAVVIGLSCLGWLPGGILFPLGIGLLAEPVEAVVFGHFLISFAVSGLIATTYSYFGVQFLVLRVLYPQLWADPQAPREQARKELGSIDGRLWLFQVLAGLIPLSGAILLLGVGPQGRFPVSYRLLLAALIGLGMAGFSAALLVSNRLSRILGVLVGLHRPEARG